MWKADAGSPKGRKISFDPAAVSAVPCKREAAGTKLDTDLVGSAGMEMNAYKGKHQIFMGNRFQERPFAYCFFYTGPDSVYYIRFILFSVVKTQIFIYA